MSFKKPFRAEPIVLGKYQIALQRKRDLRRAGKYLALACFGGMVLGAASAAFDRPQMFGSITQSTTATESAQPNSLLSGTYYSNCSMAQAAGAAPIHSGEPGYRSELDRDGDGIACEPYRN